MSKNRALILIDFINDIVHPDGKLSGKGYRKTIMPVSNHPASKALHVSKKTARNLIADRFFVLVA